MARFAAEKFWSYSPDIRICLFQILNLYEILKHNAVFSIVKKINIKKQKERNVNNMTTN